MRNYEYDDERRTPPALHSEKIVGDRKIFFLDLKENDRGRFVKITEDVRGRRDTIMLPMEVAEEFLEALQRCVEVDHEMGPVEGGGGA
ncbi:MAG: PUR family DNA/RNA-binding protein [Verrucomicrobiales bacterium]|nr:PUR family DNA/RNA-binding protein [Verrucomicrobiales bacterium]